LENRETNNLDTEKLSKFDWKKYFTQNENNEGKEEQKENPKKKIDIQKKIVKLKKI